MKTIATLILALFCIAAYGQNPPNTVNLGTTANDGTGDPIRTIFQELQENDDAAFDSLYNHLLDLLNNDSRIEADSLLTEANTTRGEADSARIDITEDMLQDSGVVRNVFYAPDYGATGDDDTNDDGIAIQAAIDAAAAEDYEGVVYIPSGLYQISTGMTLKSGVSIIMTDYTNIWPKATFTGTIFDSDGSNLRNVLIQGGRLVGPNAGAAANSNLWQGIRLYSTSTDGTYRNKIIGVDFQNADTCIILQTGDPGWVDSNTISDITSVGQRVGVVISGQGEKKGNGNTLSNIHIFAAAITTKGMYINGDRNVISGLDFMDFGLVGPANQKSIAFGPNAKWNTIIGGNLSWDEDSSYQFQLNNRANLIISEGLIHNSTRVDHVRLTYDSPTDTLIFLEGNYMIEKVRVVVSEAFNDSGTDTIKVNNQYTAGFLVDNEPCSETGLYTFDNEYSIPSTGYTSLSYFYADYHGENGDATEGIMDVYLYWTPLITGPGGTYRE